MGGPKLPGGRTVGPFRASEAYRTPTSVPKTRPWERKEFSPEAIVLRFGGRSRSGCGRSCGGFAMLPSLIPAFFACRGPLNEPSGVGGGGVDGRVVLRLSPAGIERVEWVLQSRTA